MLKKKQITYIGIEDPSTIAQINVELAGLKHLIGVAQERIASLEQALAINELHKEEVDEEK